MKYPLIVWKCSLCGIDTHINPPTEPDMGEEEVEVNIPETKVGDVERINPETGEIETVKAAYQEMKTHKVKQLVQKKCKMKRQNMFSGVMEEIEVPLYRDLFPRTISLQLKVGNEQLQINFCTDCYKKHQEKVTDFWSYIEGLPPCH